MLNYKLVMQANIEQDENFEEARIKTLSLGAGKVNNHPKLYMK